MQVRSLVAALSVVAVPALAADVQWTITGPAQVERGAAVMWEAAVAVTGENQGLAGYAFSLAIGPGSGPNAGGDGTWGTADDENLSAVVLAPAEWVNSFQVQGGAGQASVKDPAAQGGPGLSVLTSPGTADLVLGELIQVGAGYLAWDPSENVAGVGLDSRKTALLADPNGPYVLHSGQIPTTQLNPGVYTVVLIALRSRVLRTDLDYAQGHPGFVMMEAAGEGSSFQFTVTAPFIPGDFNHDGFVDGDDLGTFLSCATGPSGAYAPAGCPLDPDGQGHVAADFDVDGDVDQDDFGVFQRCYSGDLPGNPNCAD